jgi:tetratricopeptide (TPR) repeat protein
LAGSGSGFIEMQRALVLHRLGDLAAAAATYERAVELLERAGDLIPAARANSNLGILLTQTGAHDRAEQHLRRAAELAEQLGQGVMGAAAIHNLGFLQSRRGQVIEALGLFDEAERRYRMAGDIGFLVPLLADRAILLSSMNLLAEAADEVTRAFDIGRSAGNTTELADVALVAGRCRLAAGDIDGARAAASQASELFVQHGRTAWLPLVEMIDAEADERDDLLDGLSKRIETIADRLRECGWTTDAVTADVTAGRLYAIEGDVASARRMLRSAASRRRSGPATERAAAHLAMALLHESTGRVAAARGSVSIGLRTLFENPATLGSIELRAHAIAHGNALAEVGARLAIRDRRPRELLARIESARGMVALLPRPDVPDDPELAGLLTALRGINESSRDTELEPEDRLDIARRRSALEAAVRSRSRRAHATGTSEGLDLRSALAELGDRALVEYGNIGGSLWAVSVQNGRARLHELGSIDGVQADIDAIDFALHRLNRVQGSPASREAARATIGDSGKRLQAALLPDRVLRSDRPLVIVPTGRLHGLAWGALPALDARPTVVAPSLFAWVVARRGAALQRHASTTLIGGPDLSAAPAELAALARIHPEALVLDAETSIADRCIDVLGGVALAHLACHGAFRSDNPLFSSLRVADGDLTVYDLERCRRLPQTMVLSACNAAVSSVLRGGALLGMSSALIQLGVSSVIAPLTPVSDDRSVALMIRLHQRLRAGESPAEALARAALVDGELDATAAAFVALGA